MTCDILGEGKGGGGGSLFTFEWAFSWDNLGVALKGLTAWVIAW